MRSVSGIFVPARPFTYPNRRTQKQQDEADEPQLNIIDKPTLGALRQLLVPVPSFHHLTGLDIHFRPVAAAMKVPRLEIAVTIGQRVVEVGTKNQQTDSGHGPANNGNGLVHRPANLPTLMLPKQVPVF